MIRWPRICEADARQAERGDRVERKVDPIERLDGIYEGTVTERVVLSTSHASRDVTVQYGAEDGGRREPSCDAVRLRRSRQCGMALTKTPR